MPKLILPDQNGFIPSRRTQNGIKGFNPLIKQKRACHKVDLKKAFDSVRREYLLQI